MKNVMENEMTSIIESVQQLFGYLGLNGLQYGSLTTYEQTWFFWRKPDEHEYEGIYISPTIKCDSTNPTLLQCYAWVIAQARINHKSPNLHDNGEDSQNNDAAEKGSWDRAGSV